MKDRIRQIMESIHMTQQEFAEYIGTTPATLSGIFNGRTRPTVNIVELIKKKIPDINTDWLLFASGDMYGAAAPALDDATATARQPIGPSSAQTTGQIQAPHSSEPMLDFSSETAPTLSSGYPMPHSYNSVRNTRTEAPRQEVKILDKPQRCVTEIRVYYDDQTWESFVPSKK